MTVYVVRQLHWEYQDCFYGLNEETPVKAFVRRGDAQRYATQCEAQERKRWAKLDAELRNGEQVRDQVFFEVVEVELEP